MEDSPKFRPPLCPRCHYDLSGETQRWSDQCPLEGLCPECGLRFEWTHIFVSPKEPSWWIESAKRTLAPAIGTMSRSFLPFFFWRQIRLEFSGSFPRSLKLLTLTLLAWWISEIAVAAAIDYQFRLLGQIFMPSASPGPDPYAFLWKLLWPLGIWNRPNTIWLWLFAFAVPLATAALPETRRRAKAAWVHIWRVFVYATVPAALLLAATNFAAASFFWYDALSTRPSPWGGYSEDPYTALSAVPIVFYLFVSVSWTFATRRYLRLQHALPVTASLVLISALAVAALYATLWALSILGLRGLISQPW